MRAKLDGNEYALKRIRLGNTMAGLNKQMNREVRLLSGLNHEYVVRFILVVN